MFPNIGTRAGALSLHNVTTRLVRVVHGILEHRWIARTSRERPVFWFLSKGMEIIMLTRRLICLLAALLTLLGLAAPSLAADITLSGEVTYRERIALPPDARLAIALVSLADGRRIVGAESAIDKGSVPLHFTLNLRSSVVTPDRLYGLLAEIRSGGRILFRNDQPVPVDIGAPSPTLIVVGFAPQPLPPPPEIVVPPLEPPRPLLDVVWTVTSIGGEPVPSDGKLTFSIAADQRVGGNGGCNNYFTEASFEENDRLTFGPVAGTRMACEPAVTALEFRFFAALAATRGYELSGDSLRLLDAAGIPLVGLVRGP